MSGRNSKRITASKARYLMEQEKVKEAERLGEENCGTRTVRR